MGNGLINLRACLIIRSTEIIQYIGVLNLFEEGHIGLHFRNGAKEAY